MTIKKLDTWDFPDKESVPDGYDWTAIPKLTQDNFQVLIDKVNELVDSENERYLLRRDFE